MNSRNNNVDLINNEGKMEIDDDSSQIEQECLRLNRHCLFNTQVNTQDDEVTAESIINDVRNWPDYYPYG